MTGPRAEQHGLARRPAPPDIVSYLDARPVVTGLTFGALLIAASWAIDALVPSDSSHPVLIPGYAVALLWVTTLRQSGRHWRDPRALWTAAAILVLPTLTQWVVGSAHLQPTRGALWLGQAVLTWVVATYRLPDNAPLCPLHVGRLFAGSVAGRLLMIPLTPSAIEAISRHDLQQFTVSQVRGAATSFVTLTVWLAFTSRGRVDLPRRPAIHGVALWVTTIIGYVAGSELVEFVFLLLPFSVWAGATGTRREVAAHTALVSLLSTVMFLRSASDSPGGPFQHMMGGQLWNVAVVLVAFSLLRHRELTQQTMHLLDTRQRELLQQSRLIDAMHASIGDGFVLVGPDGAVSRVNSAARRLTRRLAGGPAALTDPQTAPDAAAAVASVLRDTEQAECDLTVPATGAILEVRAFTCVHLDDRVAAVILRDVTDERAASASLREFARTAAHDLRGPLTSMSLTAELASALLEGPRPGDDEVLEAKALLTQVLERVDRAEDMIAGLLDYCLDDGGALRPQPIRVSELIDSSDAMLREQGLHVRRTGDARIAVDPRIFQRVIDNILGNAVKYGRPGVPPVVDIRVTHSRDGSVDVTIDDNGVGLRAGQEELIFQTHYRDPAHAASRTGSGLGLPIARGIVERHDGTLHAERLPTGTRMHLRVPAHEAVPGTAATTAGAPANTVGPRGGNQGDAPRGDGRANGMSRRPLVGS